MTEERTALTHHLGTDLGVLYELTDEECVQFLALLTDARSRQAATLDTSLEKVLAHLPALVRGPARTIMFGKGKP